MKNLVIALTLSLFTSLGFAQSSWQEGEHYNVIAKQATANKQITEVFSYWCPACYRFEVIAEQLKKALPKGVPFTKAQVNFMGTASQQTQIAASKGMLAARAMKDETRYNRALFEAIHRDRKRVESMQDILDIYQAAGGDSKKMQKLVNSFGIKGQLAKNDKATQGMSSVPAFIVNGKYQAIYGRDMTPDSFVSLLLWLSEQP